MDMNNNVKKHMDDLLSRYPDLRDSAEKIHTLYFNLENVFFKNKTLFICGNGGSCSDAEHFIAELGKVFLSRRHIPSDLAEALEAAYPGENYPVRLQRGFRAISLNGHPSLATAYTNDVDPLMTYVREKYGADPMSMTMDTIESVETDDVIYRISFKDASGSGVVYAKKVDEYSYFEDFEANEFGFEYYQLYAVSEKNILPVFDKFVIVDNSNSTATALSIIPGVGQLYKGETLKGCGILGTEAFLTAGALVSHKYYKKYQKNADSGVPHADSWESKATSCKVARNILAGAFASVWIYNILDAAVLPGGSRVLVKRPDGQNLTISPSTSSAGLALTYRF